MTDDELAVWREFYRLYPFDDLHRYHRPAALVSASMSGGGYEEKIEFLQPSHADKPTPKPVELIR